MYNATALKTLPKNETTAAFYRCLVDQAAALTRHAQSYVSPRLDDVVQSVRAVLDARRATVTVVVFWGRHRYVSILWQYLERNLRVNGGVEDTLLAVTLERDSEQLSWQRSLALLHAAAKQYPTHVTATPFCKTPYGCAYDDIMTDVGTVYIKVGATSVFKLSRPIAHTLAPLQSVVHR